MDREDAPDNGVETTSDSAEEKAAKPSDKGGRDYESEIAELRREAARYRTERNALREDATKWQKHEEAAKSDLEKANDRVKALEAEKASLSEKANRLDVAHRFGIASENLDFLGGGSVEDMEDRAKRLVALTSTAKTAPPSGTPVEKLGTPSGEATRPRKDADSYPSWWLPRKK